MALTECVECGGKVSTRAEVCIHCGSPVEPPIPQINCPDCGEDFAGSLAACPVCGGPVVVPESSEELSESPAEQDELTVTEAEPLEVESISSEHELYEDYYPEGQLREKGFKLDGEWDGPYESYYPNGNLRNKGIYKSGKACGEWVEAGNKISYPPCSGELEVYETHYENGQLRVKGTTVGPIKDLRFHGPYESYSFNGELLKKIHYRDGTLHGPYEKWYTGTLQEKGIYKDGKKCGEWLEDGKTTTYRPCSGDPKPSGPTKRESVVTKESVATKDEPFNSAVAFAVGAFVFQIAFTLGLNFGALTVVFLLVPWALLVRYGKKQSPQVYAGILAACFLVLVIAVIGN